MKELKERLSTGRARHWGRKKSLSAVVCMLVVVGLLIQAASVTASPLHQSTTPTVWIDSDIKASFGSDITVDVMVDNAEDLGAYEFELVLTNDISKDGAEVVEIVAPYAQDGGFLDVSGRTLQTLPVEGPDYDPVARKLVFGACSFPSSSPPPPGPSGAGVLARVTLRPKALGRATLDLQNVQLVDTQGNAWPDASAGRDLTVQDGSIVVNFADVTSADSEYDYILSIYGAGVTAGCALNPPMYCPDGNVTRQELAVFQVRARGLDPYYNPTPTFSDVAPTHWAYPFVERIFEQGLTAGCFYDPGTGERRYCPLLNVSQQEMAVFMTRLAGLDPYYNPTPTFSDVAPTHWAYPFVERVFEQGFHTGCFYDPGTGERRYCPLDNVSRREMAGFLVRSAGIPSWP